MQSNIRMGGFRYVMPLPWLISNVMMLHHPSGDYTKSFAPPDNNCWAHMTPSTPSISMLTGETAQGTI